VLRTLYVRTAKLVYSVRQHECMPTGMQDRASYWNTNRNLADQSVSIPMTLSDLERRGVRGQNCLTDLHNYARMV